MSGAVQPGLAAAEAHGLQLGTRPSVSWSCRRAWSFAALLWSPILMSSCSHAPRLLRIEFDLKAIQAPFNPFPGWTGDGIVFRRERVADDHLHALVGVPRRIVDLRPLRDTERSKVRIAPVTLVTLQQSPPARLLAGPSDKAVAQ
jgi:hypothetical protein